MIKEESIVAPPRDDEYSDIQNIELSHENQYLYFQMNKLDMISSKGISSLNRTKEEE